MRVSSVSPRGATLTLDEVELMIVNNALNNIVSGSKVGEWEFHSRMGATKDETVALLEQVHSAWIDVVKQRKERR